MSTNNKTNIIKPVVTRSTSKRLIKEVCEDNTPKQTDSKKKKTHKMTSSEVNELKNIITNLKDSIENKIELSQNALSN